MPYDFNIYHSQVTPSIPDYDTITVPLTGDLLNYATRSYVKEFGDAQYLSTRGGSISGSLTVQGDQVTVTSNNNISLNTRVVVGNTTAPNSLTVTGRLLATGQVFSSGAPVVVSTSTLETPTTGISAINNIVALSQATYNALTVKLPTTLYIIV